MLSNNYEQDTRRIYDKLLIEVNVLNEIIDTENDNEKLKLAITETRKILNEYIEFLKSEYEELKKYVEWDKFTIAFYGETNAGKSTVIETLRIKYKEKTKLEDYKRFKEMLNEYNISQDVFDELQSKIKTCNRDLKVLQEEMEIEKHKKAEILDTQEKKIDELKKQIVEEKKNWSIFQKILHMFIKTASQVSYKREHDALRRLLAEREKIENDINYRYLSLLNIKSEYEKDEENIKCKLNKLCDYADGKIIGTGVSDFTKSNVVYEFNIVNNAVYVIDVPGIEGDEKQVSDEILRAVKQAHVVLFVTRKATPPQTGDNKEGTLQKIKKHLGAQTEVWTIYNKSIANPIVLDRELVSGDELESLNVLHKVLLNELGEEHYRGEIVFSARPAYLAISEGLLPLSSDMKSKKKFLEKYNASDLFIKSGFENFINCLEKDIVGDWKNKIIISNYNKAIMVLKDVISKINTIRNDRFIPLEKDLIQTVNNSKSEIDNVISNFFNRIDNIGGTWLNKFEFNVRNAMYVYIDKGIDNDDLKKELKQVMDREIECFSDVLKREFINEGNSLQNDLEKIIMRCQTKGETFIEHYIEDIKLDEIKLKFDIKSKGSVLDLIAITVSIIATIINPVNWPLAAIAIAFKAVKLIRGYLDTDYKKSQQKKNVEQNINNAKLELKKALNNNVDDLKKEVRLKQQEINKNLWSIIDIVAGINYGLSRISIKLANLAKNVEVR